MTAAKHADRFDDKPFTRRRYRYGGQQTGPSGIVNTDDNIARSDIAHFIAPLRTVAGALATRAGLYGGPVFIRSQARRRAFKAAFSLSPSRAGLFEALLKLPFLCC
jgi:hypothetical protein